MSESLNNNNGDSPKLTDKRDIQISKSLSYLLRHGATKEKLPIDENGYIQLENLLNHNRLRTHKCTHADIIRVVENNDKKRFHVKTVDDVEYIAATQGHSIKIKPNEEILTPIPVGCTLDHPLIHGTNFKSLYLILKSGYISKMDRNHTHLSPGVVGKDKNVISGMRKNSDILIYLKTERLIKRGNLFKSMNAVFLTEEDIPLDLIKKIVIRNEKKMTNELITLLNEKNIEYIFEEKV